MRIENPLLALYRCTEFSVSRGLFGQSGGDFIDSGSGLGINCAVHGLLKIGDNVMMGPDVSILTHTHNIERTDIPMGQQGM